MGAGSLDVGPGLLEFVAELVIAGDRAAPHAQAVEIAMPFGVPRPVVGLNRPQHEVRTVVITVWHMTEFADASMPPRLVAEVSGSQWAAVIEKSCAWRPSAPMLWRSFTS